MEGLEDFIWAYLDDIFVITKGSYHHVEKNVVLSFSTYLWDRESSSRGIKQTGQNRIQQSS